MPYPRGARGSAEVELELVVSAEGRVQSAALVRGDAPFADAALAAAPNFRFAPAHRAGEAIAARIRLLLRFEPPAELPPIPALTGGETSPAPAPTSAVLEVNVLGQRKPGATTLASAEVRALPGAFGDAYRAIEALPSVTPGVSGAPYFYVRGAPPGNVGYFFDDIRLPALFHVFGGPGVLHSAWLDRIDFYPGPYPAELGRYAGGIVAGQGKGPEGRLRGELSARITDSSGFIEAPLGDGSANLMLAGRYAYVQPIVRLFASDVSVSFWDAQARLGVALSPRDTLSVFAFGAKDSVSDFHDGRRRVLYQTEFERLDLRYRRELDSGWLTLGALAGVDRSRTENGDVTLRDLMASLRARSELALGDDVTLKLGADGERDEYRLDVARLEDPEQRADYLEQFPARTDHVVGGYVELGFEPSAGVRLNAGARADLYSSRGEHAFAVDPRLNAELDLGGGVSVMHGIGIAHQPPSGRLPLPGLTPALGAGLQTSLQHSSTLRLALPEAVTLSATVFQNVTFKLSDSIGQSRLDNGDDTLDDYSRATGNARGFELLVNRSLSERLGGYLSYSLQSARRTVGRAQGPALFDRRHVASGALSYSPGNGWRVGGRAMFYTGIPADVYYLAAAAAPPRTPAYYRLDLRAEKRWPLGNDGASWGLVLEVLNATLNREVLNKYCNAYVCKEERLGPITIPSIGLEATF